MLRAEAARRKSSSVRPAIVTTVPRVSARLEFFDDPAGFLAAAGEHLARDSVLNTVVATIAEREVREGVPAAPGLPHWYVVARAADDRVVGVAMRTAPFEPFPVFLLPMPGEAALLLARVLHERGEDVRGANGALPATREFAEETGRLVRRTPEVVVQTRLHQLHRLVAPPTPAGALRPARADEVDLVLRWYHAFHREADEQAGRPPGTMPMTGLSREEMLVRIRGGRVFLWHVDGEPVHLTAANPPAYGAARIGPVFTPAEHRGHGYAAAAVAQVSQLLVDEGSRPCLFTDQANPVSNRLYERLGYEPVVDMADLVIGRSAAGEP
jgi:GNAT superfamily N-acetyltransferase